MAILVGCEASGKVTKALCAQGLEAYSCDIEATYGDHPEWHLQGDLLDILQQRSWAALIAFPPCTHLAVSGSRWFAEKRADGRQDAAIRFFMACYNAPVPKVAIENPVGIMSSLFRKPDQIIQPWQHGHAATKATCLWLRGLPSLTPSNIVDKGEMIQFGCGRRENAFHHHIWTTVRSEDRAKIRSETFDGIAAAMAYQWAPYL